MQRVPFYQINSFTTEQFRGNPAVVVPLERWLSDDEMQAIAVENNVAETTFFVPTKDKYQIRWFTPKLEIDLCGHATLAAAYVLFRELNFKGKKITFRSLSGDLVVEEINNKFSMNFPKWELIPFKGCSQDLIDALGKEPIEVLITDPHKNYFVLYESEQDILELNPDFEILGNLDSQGVVVTAPGENSDCVSRFFAPSLGISEDPATGSVHCGLAPFWGERLAKNNIYAKQLSQRGAEIFCAIREDRVLISGFAVKYRDGWIEL